MIEFVTEKKIINKDKWNYFHHFPIFPLLVVNDCIPIFHMSKIFVYLHNTEEHINQFEIEYMVNPTLHGNKAFKDQVEKP